METTKETKQAVTANNVTATVNKAILLNSRIKKLSEELASLKEELVSYAETQDTSEKVKILGDLGEVGVVFPSSKVSISAANQKKVAKLKEQLGEAAFNSFFDTSTVYSPKGEYSDFQKNLNLVSEVAQEAIQKVVKMEESPTPRVTVPTIKIED
jgi:hypothetical protein